jgi:GT2 family glycosyltransferase
MNVLPVSVVVVSRDRPASLRLCLLALTQQDHRNFEVVVVADPAGLAVAGAFVVKLVEFDEANISNARNAGIDHTAGEIIAFIDDDAVAEPTWLSRLVAPFADSAIQAATGFVRGRNGISLQWGAAWVDSFGADHPFDLLNTGETFDALANRAIKTQGTNCAFRRGALLAAGGFDPAYRFYHDETDLNLRMKARTTVVPLAQVVHGFAQSARRRADRLPKSLTEIGASSAIFLRRHAPQADFEQHRLALHALQSRRLLAHRRAGRKAQQDAASLLAGFVHGWTAGMQRELLQLVPRQTLGTAFLAFPDTGPREGMALCARSWQKASRMAEATKAVATGKIVTVFCLSLTARPHWLRFTENGFWVQSGGVFGRSERKGPAFQFSTLRKRVAEESLRLQAFRPISELE